VGIKQIIQIASLKVILWPRRPYADSFMKVRFNNLIDYLESVEDYERLKFVIGSYLGENLYIFSNHVMVEGKKGLDTDTPGYDITNISYHGPTISSAINSFDFRFNELWIQHAKTCRVEATTGAAEIRKYVINELKIQCGFIDL
jgi:hypothetical protein